MAEKVSWRVESWALQKVLGVHPRRRQVVQKELAGGPLAREEVLLRKELQQEETMMGEEVIEIVIVIFLRKEIDQTMVEGKNQEVVKQSQEILETAQWTKIPDWFRCLLEMVQLTKVPVQFACCLPSLT